MRIDSFFDLRSFGENGDRTLPSRIGAVKDPRWRVSLAHELAALIGTREYNKFVNEKMSDYNPTIFLDLASQAIHHNRN